jgi:hypothetical protein
VRLGVRTKLFLVSIALIVASMGAADAYLTSSISSHLTDAIRSDLFARARLVARAASSLPAPSPTRLRGTGSRTSSGARPTRA